MAENKLNIKNINELKNDDFKRALQVFKEQRSPGNEQRMLNELGKAHLCVPAMISGKPPRMQIKFLTLPTKDGKALLPAFTDIEEAKKVKVPQEIKNLQYVIWGMEELTRFFQDPNNQIEGVVFNALSNGIVMPKKAFVAIAAAKKEKQKEEADLAQGKIPGIDQMQFVEPRIYPTALVNAVYETARLIEGVERVWFKQVMAGMSTMFALIVEAKPCDEALKTKIHDAAVPHSKNVPVIVLEYTPELEKKAVRDTVPLFDRAMEF